MLPSARRRILERVPDRAALYGKVRLFDVVAEVLRVSGLFPEQSENFRLGVGVAVNRPIFVDLQFPIVHAIGITVAPLAPLAPPHNVPPFIDEVSFGHNARCGRVSEDAIGHREYRRSYFSRMRKQNPVPDAVRGASFHARNRLSAAGH